jgi:hypothetical protein
VIEKEEHVYDMKAIVCCGRLRVGGLDRRYGCAIEAGAASQALRNNGSQLHKYTRTQREDEMHR